MLEHFQPLYATSITKILAYLQWFYVIFLKDIQNYILVFLRFYNNTKLSFFLN